MARKYIDKARVDEARFRTQLAIDPTILFDEKYEFTLGEVQFQLFSTSGETPDHLTVWIPKYKTAFIGDNYNGFGEPEPMSFPNLYALRGTKPRWALDWVSSIDKVLVLKPDVLLSGHGDPIVGNPEITRRLIRFRNAIQYIHDEVVKGMNSGKDVFTLMREIKLPASFDMTESFGKVSWSVRGIYDGYAGWFDMNVHDVRIATILRLPGSSQTRRRSGTPGAARTGKIGSRQAGRGSAPDRCRPCL